MSLNDWKNIADIFQSSSAGLAIIVGGGWAFWKYIILRESHAKIEFILDLNVLGSQQDRILVEIIAVVTNKGAVRRWISDFKFNLLCIKDNEQVIDGNEDINYQVLFTPVIRNRYWIPPDREYSFIDPGVNQRYTYVTSLSGNATYALIYATFKHPDEKREHFTAQRVFNLRNINHNIRDKNSGQGLTTG